mgnify:CR=1 FL=1
MRVQLLDTPEDFSVFRTLIVEYELSLPNELKHSDFEGELDNLELHYGPPNVALVALVDEEPAGCVALVPLDASTAIMKKLYVTPAFRNIGVARKLLATLIDAAREHRFSRIVLDTDRDRLEAAYRLYLSLGFAECEPYGEVDHASPTFMELHLA